MSFFKNLDEVNKRGILYLKGNANTDGSIRLSVDKGIVIVQKRIGGIFESSSFKVGPQSFDLIVTTEDGVTIDSLGNLIIKN